MDHLSSTAWPFVELRFPSSHAGVLRVCIGVQSFDIRSADSRDGEEGTSLCLLGWPKVVWICPAVTCPALCPMSCAQAAAPAAGEEPRTVGHISQLLAATVRARIHLECFTSPSSWAPKVYPTSWLDGPGGLGEQLPQPPTGSWQPRGLS